MKFYKFWARATAEVEDPDGEAVFRTGTGYSNDSVADAFLKAEIQAKKNAQRWSDPTNFSHGGYYPAGGERAIREETVEQFADDNETYAVISRNSYGCLILNTTDVFFADVDKPKKANWLFSWLGGLFGKKKITEADFESELIQKIKRLVNANPQYGLRVYRTLLGYRVVLTSQTVPASEAKSVELLKKLGADELYVSLCRSQDCYRARLTPKPWRCGARKPTIRFPFSTPEAEQKYRRWQKRYEATASKFATCVLIGEFGSNQVDPRVAQILKLHDMFVLNSDKPLA